MQFVSFVTLQKDADSTSLEKVHFTIQIICCTLPLWVRCLLAFIAILLLLIKKNMMCAFSEVFYGFILNSLQASSSTSVAVVGSESTSALPQQSMFDITPPTISFPDQVFTRCFLVYSYFLLVSGSQLRLQCKC